MNATLLEVKNLSLALTSAKASRASIASASSTSSPASASSRDIQALSQSRTSLLREASLTVRKGEVIALVGESGSGKTLFALSLLGLLAENEVMRTGGEILYYPTAKEVWSLESEADFRKVRSRHINMIFQEPTSYLNPLLRMRTQMHEVFHIHKQEVDEKRIEDLLQQMGLSDKERIYNSYPHQLSGGMLQRVFFVMTLLLQPCLIIADEPTTALDLTNQKRLLKIMKDVSARENVAIILITHNIHLASKIANRIVSMVSGFFVEMGDAQQLLKHPAHPYTQALLHATPKFHWGKPPQDYALRPMPTYHEDTAHRQQYGAADGAAAPTSADGAASGKKAKADACVFYRRCPKRQTVCQEMPDWFATASGQARCLFTEQDKMSMPYRERQLRRDKRSETMTTRQAK